MCKRHSTRAAKDLQTAKPAILMLVCLVILLQLPARADQPGPGKISAVNETNKTPFTSEAKEDTPAAITAADTDGRQAVAGATSPGERKAYKGTITGLMQSPAGATANGGKQENDPASIRSGQTAASEVTGFTYSDERALEMRSALANLRNRRSDIAIVDAHGQLLNAFGQPVGEFFAHRLPNGEVILIPGGGVEEHFLSDLGSEAGPGETVYTLDRLFFATGSVALDRESTNQVESIAAILRAYRNLGILIRGHTDNRGSADANMELSKARADAVRQALVELGIDATRMQTTGAGSTEPLGSNATPEGRRMNRRIDISVM